MGLSHISVNASMTINDTALTNGTISRLEIPDPIDSLDLTVCPGDDILDGCKVSKGKVNIMKCRVFFRELLIYICFVAVSVWPAHKEAGEAAPPGEHHRGTSL